MAPHCKIEMQMIKRTCEKWPQLKSHDKGRHVKHGVKQDKIGAAARKKVFQCPSTMIL
jgi:hypothetical protein